LIHIEDGITKLDRIYEFKHKLKSTNVENSEDKRKLFIGIPNQEEFEQTPT